MRVVNSGARLAIEIDGRILDVAERSGGHLPQDPMAMFEVWTGLLEWAGEQSASDSDPLTDPLLLGPPVPNPTQVFAIGLNYKDHAEEASLPIPGSPMVFTKFPSCLAGPTAEVPLTSDRVDWEVEQGVVIGREAHRVPAARAYEYVAGFSCGQDVSDRRVQFKDKPAQFSLGKSAAAFGPFGPALVSLDEFENPDALVLRCWVEDELMQESSTANLIFPVSELIETISRYCILRPGDLIFTGTPAGVGSVREPRRYLAPGETIRSEIEGIGQLSNRCVAGQ